MTAKKHRSSTTQYKFPECSRCYARPDYCNGRVAANASGHCPLYIDPSCPAEWRDKGLKKLIDKPPF